MTTLLNANNLRRIMLTMQRLRSYNTRLLVSTQPLPSLCCYFVTANSINSEHYLDFLQSYARISAFVIFVVGDRSQSPLKCRGVIYIYDYRDRLRRKTAVTMSTMMKLIQES